MRCPNSDCGRLNRPGAKFCTACGSPLEDDGKRTPVTICPSCGTKITDLKSPYCPQCLILVNKELIETKPSIPQLMQIADNQVLPLMLHKDEVIINSVSDVRYLQTKNITTGGGMLLSTPIAPGFIGSSETTEITDQVIPCQMFLTNTRLVFIQEKIDRINKKKCLSDTILREIPLNTIIGVSAVDKIAIVPGIFLNISMKTQNDQVKNLLVPFSFPVLDTQVGYSKGTDPKRAPERDTWVRIIKEAWEKTPSEPPNQGQKLDDTDPLKLLKIRFVKGEITKEQYDEMKSILES